MTESPVPSLAIYVVDAAPEGTDSGPDPEGAGREALVRRLFQHHRAPLLHHLCGLLSCRTDAEDVLQEAYTRLLSVPHLDETGSKARAYLFRIATNLAFDCFRRKSTISLDAAEAVARMTDIEGSPDRIVDFAQGLAIVRETVLDLKPRCRRVFLLRASEGLSYSAIADALGVSKRTVEREMQHALQVCQARLKRSQ